MLRGSGLVFLSLRGAWRLPRAPDAPVIRGLGFSLTQHLQALGESCEWPPHRCPRPCEEGAKKASWPPAGSAGGASQTPSDLPTASRLPSRAR